MRDTAAVIERETVFVRKFADSDARDRDEPEAVQRIVVVTENGIAHTFSDEGRRGDPRFDEMDRQAKAQIARAKGAE